MSLRQDVCDAIHRRGETTLDDLQCLFPDFDRKQLGHAVENGRRSGRIEIVKAGGRGRSMALTIYGPANKPALPAKGGGVYLRKRQLHRLSRISSVFLMANEPLPAVGRSWPPRVGESTVHRKLGAWTDA